MEKKEKELNDNITNSLDYIIIDTQIENKFQALKLLNNKKIKLLMTTINSQEKEIGKLKILSKDNRRTQMIQSLKKKLKDQEYITDILKDELHKKNEMSREEVNDYIIRKSISGPKRFRPLTREELEQQIIELEKKVKTKNSQQSISSTAIESNGGNSNTNGIEKRTPQKELNNNNNNNNNNAGSVGKRSNQNLTTMESKDDTQYLSKISELQNEILELQQTCDRRDNTIVQLKDEINRLRSINSQLLSVEEERNIIERQYNNLTLQHERIIEELEELLRQNGLLQEESHQLRSEYEIEVENYMLEINVLKEQAEKGLKQNTQLLRHMSEIESQIDKKKREGFNDSVNISAASDSYNSNNNIQNEKLKLANQKIQLLESQLKSTHHNTNESQSELNILKATLREKNEVIRELKRNLNEFNRLKENSKDTSPIRLNSNNSDKEQTLTKFCDCLLTYQLDSIPSNSNSNSSSNKSYQQNITNLIESLQQLKRYYSPSTSIRDNNNLYPKLIKIEQLLLKPLSNKSRRKNEEMMKEFDDDDDDDDKLNGTSLI